LEQFGVLLLGDDQRAHCAQEVAQQLQRSQQHVAHSLARRSIADRIHFAVSDGRAICENAFMLLAQRSENGRKRRRHLEAVVHLCRQSVAVGGYSPGALNSVALWG
jgi:hypothetical protein